MKKLKVVFVLVLVLCVVGCNSSSDKKKKKSQAPDNSMLVIEPYRLSGTWVFDDPSVGLVREPFVSGIPEMIDILVSDIPDADKGFRLIFSAKPFPGYAMKLAWRREEKGGNWYYCEKSKKEGWLCPALFKYFKTAPKEIYAKGEKLVTSSR